MLELRGGQVFRPEGRFEEGSLRLAGQSIVDYRPTGQAGELGQEGPAEVLDCSGCYVVPGFIDSHFHGCMGKDICDAEPQALRKIASQEAQWGVTALVATTMSYGERELQGILGAYRSVAAEEQEQMAAFCGVHLEGPFINPKRCGAQNPDYIMNPDADMLGRLDACSGGALRIVTMAPECDGASELIARYHERMSLSIGHSEADYCCARHAYQAGMSRLTHCYNAMRGIHHRDPGPILAALEFPHVFVELITDGVHVHPSVVRQTFKLFGAERIVLVSDSMEATGLADGRYQLGGQAVQVQGRRATLDDGTLAGSVTHLADCVRRAVQEMEIPLEQAILSASSSAARAAGFYAQRGSLEAGKVADVLVLDSELRLRQVILRGKPL